MENPTAAAKKNAALNKAREQKTLMARLRVEKVLSQLQNEKMPINFNTVAKQAKVSKTWLYTQADYRVQIEAYRGEVQTRQMDLTKVVAKKDNEIKQLKNEILKLEKTLKGLKNQLEIVYGELYKQG
jgi:hypothetical protein